MNARKVLDSVKSRLNIPTDKELAVAMGVQYGALTSALSRGSIQYEAVINLLLKENVNLNEIFGEGSIVQNITNSSGITAVGDNFIGTRKQKDEDDFEIFEEFKEKYNFYKKNGGNLITDQFDADLRTLFEKHDRNVKILKEALLK